MADPTAEEAPPPPPSPPATNAAARYVIFRPERVGLLDVVRLLVTKRRFVDYHFVEASDDAMGQLEDAVPDPNVLISLLLLKLLHLIKRPLAWLGGVVEYLLNLMTLNGGFIGFLRNIVAVSVTFPRSEEASYRSVISLVDGRLDPYQYDPHKKEKKTSDDNSDPVKGLLDQEQGGDDGEKEEIALKSLLDLTTLSSKIAYENPAYIKDAVENHFMMNFVEFFSCWNIFLKNATTQGFIFTDKAENAERIFVVFRGTELFDAMDWSVDLDLSRIAINPKMGTVHLGFMKALGLRHETDFSLGFPADDAEKDDGRPAPLAYYAVRKAVAALLGKHPNATVTMTGHSQGGALAVLFVAVLAYHGQHDVLDRVAEVVTHGQPRVGDAIFASYMESMVLGRAAAGKTTTTTTRYHRTVYRHDIVPRIPFDRPPIFQFKHFGVCFYYRGWYARVKEEGPGEEEPNPNFFEWSYLGEMFRGAWDDLSDALGAGEREGPTFEEGWISLALRLYGLTFPGMAFHSPRDYLNAARLSLPASATHEDAKKMMTMKKNKKKTTTTTNKKKNKKKQGATHAGDAFDMV